MNSSPAIFFTAPGNEGALIDELLAFNKDCGARVAAPTMVRAAFDTSTGNGRPVLAFATQCLPNPESTHADSISESAELLFSKLQSNESLLADSSWSLHIFDVTTIGKTKQPRRAALIRSALDDLLKKKLRSVRRTFATTTPTRNFDHSLLQFAICPPNIAILSLASPHERAFFRHCISPVPAGTSNITDDKFPPSRAYKKLLEAEINLGEKISSNQLCVDLGASPGGWSAIALKRGALLTAVDRAPLRRDLMQHQALTFMKQDGFSYTPSQVPVDWLLCDIIAFPQRSLALLDTWLTKAWCKHFVVTIKFRGQADYAQLNEAKRILAKHCQDFFLRRLGNNKNEVTAAGFGTDPAEQSA